MSAAYNDEEEVLVLKEVSEPKDEFFSEVQGWEHSWHYNNLELLNAITHSWSIYWLLFPSRSNYKWFPCGW